MGKSRRVALLGALALSACGGRAVPTSGDADASPAPVDAALPGHDAACVEMTCGESLSAFCAKVGCPLHAFSLDSGDPRWCTIGAVAAFDAQAGKSGAHWLSIEIDQGQSATLLYDYGSSALVFVLGPNLASCLAGEVPPEAQCQPMTYTGAGLDCG